MDMQNTLIETPTNAGGRSVDALMDTLTETETPTNAGGRSVDAVPSERLSGMPVHRDINWERGDKEDDGLAVEFYFNKVNEKDHCRIMFPGDDRTVHDQPVHRERQATVPPSLGRLQEPGGRLRGYAPDRDRVVPGRWHGP